MNLPFLILEGGDGTGKSTVAAFLVKRWGEGIVFHYGKPDADALELYVARLARWLGNTPLVLDRSFIGSRVWSRLGFHKPTLTSPEWRSICRWYAENGAVAWILVKAPDDIAAVLVERNETNKQINEALTGQSEFMNLLIHGDILYIPCAAVSAGLATNITEGDS